MCMKSQVFWGRFCVRSHHAETVFTNLKITSPDSIPDDIRLDNGQSQLTVTIGTQGTTVSGSIPGKCYIGPNSEWGFGLDRKGSNFQCHISQKVCSILQSEQPNTDPQIDNSIALLNCSQTLYSATSSLSYWN